MTHFTRLDTFRILLASLFPIRVRDLEVRTLVNTSGESEYFAAGRPTSLSNVEPYLWRTCSGLTLVLVLSHFNRWNASGIDAGSRIVLYFCSVYTDSINLDRILRVNSSLCSLLDSAWSFCSSYIQTLPAAWRFYRDQWNARRNSQRTRLVLMTLFFHVI